MTELPSAEWKGPVLVPDGLPNDEAYESGVYLWVRRYRENGDGALRGLVIYVGKDAEIPKRMFAHLVQLLGGGHDVWGEAGKVYGPETEFHAFAKYKNRDDFDRLLKQAKDDFYRSEYFYLPCADRHATEGNVCASVRRQIGRSRRDDPVWIVLHYGGRCTSNEKVGAADGSFIDASELDGKALLRWLGLMKLNEEEASERGKQDDDGPGESEKG